jgi:DNA-binding MarR family transcriptional regulator
VVTAQEETRKTGPAGVEGDLGWALGTLLRAYLRHAKTVLSGVPGGARGYKVLSSVAHDCPSSQLALAQLIGLDRTVVTYLVDDLVAADLVERTPDPADRRARRVVATMAGRARLALADKQLATVEEHLLGTLSVSERDDLRSLLHRVAVSVHKDGVDGLNCSAVEEFAAADDL